MSPSGPSIRALLTAIEPTEPLDRVVDHVLQIEF
jgi:hypothetical protein